MAAAHAHSLPPTADAALAPMPRAAHPCALACLPPPPQKLLDAKLKRVAQEGAAARAAGRSPLAGARDDERDDATGGLPAAHRSVGHDLQVSIHISGLLFVCSRASSELLPCTSACRPCAYACPRLVWPPLVHALPACPRQPVTCPPLPPAPAADLEAEQALADAAMAALLEEEERWVAGCAGRRTLAPPPAAAFFAAGHAADHPFEQSRSPSCMLPR